MSDDKKVPRANRQLINKVLKLAKLIYDNRNENGYADDGGLPVMFDPCFNEPDFSSASQIRIAVNNNYPMLTFMIENWDYKIKYDEQDHKFKQIILRKSLPK